VVDQVDQVYEVRTSAADYVIWVMGAMLLAGQAVFYVVSRDAVLLAIPGVLVACGLVGATIYWAFYAPLRAVLTDEGIRFEAKARQIFVRWGELDTVRSWGRFSGARSPLTFQTFAGRSIRMPSRIHDLHHMLVEIERRSPRTKVTY
jgi:hypothetical protein